MVKKREYIYICEKCQNEIKSSDEIIICSICENVIDAKKTSWSSHSSKRAINKPNIISRYLNSFFCFIGLLSIKWKMALLLFCVITFLLLPIEIYDLAFFTIMLIAASSSVGCLINLELWKYSSFFKLSILYIVIFFSAFFIYNYSYNFRCDSLFIEKGKTISAQIVEYKTKHVKHSRITYAVYSYSIEGKKYLGKEIISKDQYSNLYYKHAVLIDYVVGRPRISRINENSFIPDKKARVRYYEQQKSKEDIVE